MRIISKTLALAALLLAFALPATIASAQSCGSDPYCNPHTPDLGDIDVNTGSSGGGGETDRGDSGGGDSGGGDSGGGGLVEGEETTGGAGEVAPGSSIGAPDVVSDVAPAGVETARSAPSGALPLTGGDVVQLAIIGVAVIGVGTVIVRRSRAATTVNA